MNNMIESISAATFKGLQDFSTMYVHVCKIISNTSCLFVFSNLNNNHLRTIPIGTFSDFGRIDQL